MAIFNTSGHRVIQSSNRSATNVREYRHGNINTGPVGTGAQQTVETKSFAAIEAAKLGKNPYAFRQISFPTDITTNPARGHYMLFYVNVQNKTKYKHTGAADGLEVGNQVARVTKYGPTRTEYSKTTWHSAENEYEYN